MAIRVTVSIAPEGGSLCDVPIWDFTVPELDSGVALSIPENVVRQLQGARFPVISAVKINEESEA